MATKALELIYCAGGNRRLAEIAKTAGFLLGSQLPETVYLPIHFADQDWMKPRRDVYLRYLAQHRPYIASVLDLEWLEQLPEVLGWAEDVAQFVEEIMIIPKFQGAIRLLPRRIANRPVRLGYSVPTKHGGTVVPFAEFSGWPVHLLGGSPHAQMRHTKYASLNVVSVDGNMHSKMARRGQFWAPGDCRFARNRYWPTIIEADGKRWGDGSAKADAPYEAFRRSCQNIMSAWGRL